jgi:hypothetical protein
MIQINITITGTKTKPKVKIAHCSESPTKMEVGALRTTFADGFADHIPALVVAANSAADELSSRLR